VEQITDINVLKQYQLGNLLALHRFCTEKKINYSLAYGSLLGAIRHQGIIPWDDDIDVCLLRDEYNRLIQEFPIQLEGKYSLHSLERQKDYVRPYARLCDDTTLETFQDNVPMPPMGIGIDIFPIDEVPEDEKEWQKFNKKRRRLVLGGISHQHLPDSSVNHDGEPLCWAVALADVT
jgi:lipopolysaccharide cholinephosphotransferase